MANQDQFIPQTPDWVKPIISEAARQYNVPTVLLSAQLNQESGFNPNAYSGAGAMGIAQFIDSTAKAYGVNPWDVKSAIAGQAHYMSDLLKQYGTTERALSAYNSGQPDAYKNPSFGNGETTNYVNSITGQIRNTPAGQTYTPPPTPNIPTPNYNAGPKMSIQSPSPTLASSYASSRSSAPLAYSAPASGGNGGGSYVVQPGDTLWGIAQKLTGNGANWQQLQGFNGNPRQLPIGTKLSLPGSPKLA